LAGGRFLADRLPPVPPEIYRKRKGKPMKLKHPLAALAAVLVLTGCEQTRQSSRLTPEASAARAASIADKQRQIQMSIDALNAYLARQRAMFAASMQENVTDMDQKIAALGDAIAMLEDNTVADNNLEAVRELRSRFDLLFEDLTQADAESWDGAKRTLEWAWRDLQMAYQLVKDIYDN